MGIDCGVQAAKNTSAESDKNSVRENNGLVLNVIQYDQNEKTGCSMRIQSVPQEEWEVRLKGVQKLIICAEMSVRNIEMTDNTENGQTVCPTKK